MKQELAETIIKDMRQLYNAVAPQWDQTRKHVWSDVTFLKEVIFENATVVDVGCGNARILKLFDSVNVDYIGIDGSVGLIEIAQQRYPEHKFKVGNMLAVPVEDGVADVVICMAALHHVPSVTFRQQAISELARIMKPGGKLVMTNWSSQTPQFRWRYYRSLIWPGDYDRGDIVVPWGAEKRPRYVHLFQPKELTELLVKAGFCEVKNWAGEPSSRGYANLVTTAQKC